MTFQAFRYKARKYKPHVAASKLSYPQCLIIDAVDFSSKKKRQNSEFRIQNTGGFVIYDLRLTIFFELIRVHSW
jgi:hypothetical protein